LGNLYFVGYCLVVFSVIFNAKVVNYQSISMKKGVLVSFVIALSLVSGGVFGQQKSSDKLAAKQNETLDKSIVSGHFEINKPNKERGIIEHINVNYAISPAPFSNYLQLQLSTPDPTTFSAQIIDQKGEKRIHWKPQQVSHSYNESIDLSKLEPGGYQIDIYADNQSERVYSISFQKVQGAQ